MSAESWHEGFASLRIQFVIVLVSQSKINPLPSSHKSTSKFPL
jgi:hypothetical protein